MATAAIPFCSSEKINGNKTHAIIDAVPNGFVLAKKLMVTKHVPKGKILATGFVLAKKLMVTKL